MSRAATGVVLQRLEEVKRGQLDLFGESFRIERMERLFACVDAIKAKYGKQYFGQFLSERVHK